MGWKQERDSLIAQTLAFVQSVRGKDEASRSPAWADNVRDAVGDALPERFAPEPIEPLKTPPPIQPAAVAASSERAEIVEVPPPSAPPPRPIVYSELQDEIRARIASFRAHQERFNREREEYFGATLARLKAAMKEQPTSRLGK